MCKFKPPNQTSLLSLSLEEILLEDLLVGLEMEWKQNDLGYHIRLKDRNARFLKNNVERNIWWDRIHSYILKATLFQMRMQRLGEPFLRLGVILREHQVMTILLLSTPYLLFWFLKKRMMNSLSFLHGKKLLLLLNF